MKLEKDYKRKLQLKILDIVKDIDDVCKKNNIEYYILYGSALGAIRHKGFIPWDDDFDIGMTYDNYVKFLEVCEQQLDKNKYYVQTPDKEEDYYLSFSKIRDITTTLIEEGNKDIDIVRSIYVDVFPIVGCPDNKFKEEILKINRAFMLSANKNIINNKVFRGIFNVILKIFGRKRILKYTTKRCFKYDCNSSKYWVSIADGDSFEQNKLEKSVYGKPRYIDFEDTKLPVPEKTDEYLRNIYGNYMEIPSKEQIKAREHTPYFLDFNLPYKKSTFYSDNKKKLLFIIWSFSYGGGAEKILANIVNNIDSNKYKIDIIEYWNANIKREYVNDGITILPPIINAQKDSKIKKVLYKIILETFPNILRRKYIRENYDVEISFNYMIPTFLLSKKCKTISWIHGDVYDLQKNKRNYLLQRKSFKYVDKIVAISNNTYNSLINVYPEYSNKVILINNGFNTKEIIQKSKEIKLSKSKVPSLLFINRFDENKNPIFAVEVAKILKEDNINFKLYFVGKGDLDTKINEKIKEYNLDNEVEILGYKKNPYPYIRNSDIVLGCSKSEGFPTIFVEAITLGKPFVTTNVGGAAEISDNQKCGLIADNINDYVNDIKILINDKNEYKKLSEYGKKYVETFSIEKQIQKIDKLIEGLVGVNEDE